MQPVLATLANMDTGAALGALELVSCLRLFAFLL